MFRIRGHLSRSPANLLTFDERCTRVIRHVFRLSEGPPLELKVQQDGSVTFVGTNFSSPCAHWWDLNMRMPYVSMLILGKFQF